jgi:hypothetical protein
MPKSNTKSQKISIFIIIILAVVARLIPHAPNFAPIGGLALFSGSHFKKKVALLIPLAAMFISDIFLGFHKAIPYVYVSFIVIALIGGLIKNSKWQSILKASFASSVLFFFITNFGVWATGTMYQKNLTGLIQCYGFGMPFFRNTLVSDLFYSYSFFYGYRFMQGFIIRKFRFLKRIKTLS